MAWRARRLSVTDRSLLDRAFGVAAQKQGLKVEGSAYREQMRAALPFIISAAVPAEIAKLVTEPLQAFLAGGQTILADAAPPAPLSDRGPDGGGGQSDGPAEPAQPDAEDARRRRNSDARSRLGVQR